MRALHHLRRRARCVLRTKGLHEFALDSGRCIYCRRRWADIYPPGARESNSLGAGALRGQSWLTRWLGRSVKT